jgi:MotA/TolQ/ExbB proton channel family
MRLTFLSHFIICLACAASLWFAHVNGALATVWANDQSMMTSAIGALFLATAAWLGWQAWRADEPAVYDSVAADASFGHLAERLLPMLGLFGTAFGLSLQAKALAGGATSFAALATSLYTTACGVLAAFVVAIMTFNLEQRVRRARGAM